MNNDNYKQEMQDVKASHRERVDKAQDDRGIVIVNTGDGKGKSTAAFGTAFRAVGQGMKVAIIQFIKGKWKTGEMAIFDKFPEITHVISGEGFTWDTQDKEKDIAAANRGWDLAKEIITAAEKKYDLLVLDEFNMALDYGFVDLNDAVATISNKPDTLNIIITGRNAPQQIIEIADTVTEMRPIKHAFEGGIKAQKGIEF